MLAEDRRPFQTRQVLAALRRLPSPRLFPIYVDLKKKESPLLRPLFEKHAKELPPTTEREISLYDKHFEHLKQWNEKISLVSRRSIDQAFAPHYADSLFISEFVQRHYPEGPVYDIGTGAGFPGMLFGIRYPERSVFLHEKLQKKGPYLVSALETLALSNVRFTGVFVASRVAGLFLARAVMPREELAAFFRKSVPPGSRIVLNLGGAPKEDEAPLEGFDKIAAEKYSLPEAAGDRRIELYTVVPRETK